MTQCPCCGQVTDLPAEQDALVRLKHLAIDGIPPIPGQVLQCLIEKKGQWVAREKLVDRAYSDRIDGGPEAASKILYVVIFQLRKKIAPLGFAITNKHTFGYRLEYMKDAA